MRGQCIGFVLIGALSDADGRLVVLVLGVYRNHQWHADRLLPSIAIRVRHGGAVQLGPRHDAER